MKIFVWEGDGVLTDYTNGMIVAIAADLESALLAIEAKCDCCMQSFPNHKPTQVVELGDCGGYSKPDAWVCWGGG